MVLITISSYAGCMGQSPVQKLPIWMPENQSGYLNEPMQKIAIVFSLALSLFCSTLTLAQTPGVSEKMSVSDRMAKARAVKAEKKLNPTTNNSEKATPADYRTPVNKVLKGPHGEVVHEGERGGKYYINKNGQKTYLSSNQ